MTNFNMGQRGCGLAGLEEIAGAGEAFVPPSVAEIEQMTLRLVQGAESVERERELFAIGAAGVAAVYGIEQVVAA